MGCFSRSCSVSGMPITYGARCGIVLLKPATRSLDLTKGIDCTLLWGESSMYNMYKPHAFPIFGTYDDYGRIENIERDANVLAIEDYYKAGIDDIIGVVCSSFHKDKIDDMSELLYEELLSVSITFVRGEFYDALSKELRNDIREQLPEGNSYLLESLGFTESMDPNETRYNKIFTNGEFIIHSDGEYTKDWIENLSQLQELAHDKGVWLDIAKVNKGHAEQVYDLALSNPKFGKSIYRAHSEQDAHRLLLEYDYYKKLSGLSRTYYEHIKKDPNGLRDAVINWTNFSTIYYILGKELMPVANSPQNGDYEIYEKFIDVLSTIGGAAIDRYKELQDDDE